MATQTAPHRWSRPRDVVPCRQDTRVEDVRQSARASSPRPAASARTATTRDPGVCGVAVADGLGRLPAIERCSHARDGPASCYGRIRGTGCWALGPRLAPARVATRLGPDPDSRSHGLPHSSVCNISFAWEHRSPSGPVVLHLELEFKVLYNQISMVLVGSSNRMAARWKAHRIR